MSDPKHSSSLGGGPQAKSKKERSPNYPQMSLKAAIERARQFYAEEKKQAAPAVVAMKHLGFSSPSGPARVVLSTLVKYGLLDEEGRGENRQVKLSRLALNILLDERPESSERDEAIKLAALKPKILANLWVKWGPDHPSEATVRTYLIRDLHFTDSAADDLIRVYKDTVEFAKLASGDTIAPASGGDKGTVNDDNVGSSHTSGIRSQREKRAMQPGMKEAVFPLDEGQAVLQWPERLSPESFEDFEAWLNIIIRRAKRSIRPEDEEAEPTQDDE
jgi:hypothetical protein